MRFKDGSIRCEGGRCFSAGAAGPLLTAIAVVLPLVRGKMRSARFIFPLRGKTAAQQPVGGKYGDRASAIPELSLVESREFNALQLNRARQSSALKPPVFCSHLVARKGRKASDHCGGGG